MSPSRYSAIASRSTVDSSTRIDVLTLDHASTAMAGAIVSSPEVSRLTVMKVTPLELCTRAPSPSPASGATPGRVIALPRYRRTRRVAICCRWSPISRMPMKKRPKPATTVGPAVTRCGSSHRRGPAQRGPQHHPDERERGDDAPGHEAAQRLVAGRLLPHGQLPVAGGLGEEEGGQTVEPPVELAVDAADRAVD